MTAAAAAISQQLGQIPAAEVAEHSRMGHAEAGRDLADGQPLRPQLAGPLDPLLPPTLSRRDRPGQPAQHSGQGDQLPRRLDRGLPDGLRIRPLPT